MSSCGVQDNYAESCLLRPNTNAFATGRLASWLVLRTYLSSIQILVIVQRLLIEVVYPWVQALRLVQLAAD